MLDPSDSHYTIITTLISNGDLVPFLGAGANLCGRPQDAAWQEGSQYLPSGRELAALLAAHYGFPKKELTPHCPSCQTELKLTCPSCRKEVHAVDEAQDLLRIAQYVEVTLGPAHLYKDLHKIFAPDYPPTSLHRFLAALPATLAEKGYPARDFLVVTTNYDTVMERAFEDAKQPCDVVTYVAQGENRGRFLHWPPKGDPVLIPDNTYAGLFLEQRPVVLKIHGAVNKINRQHDSFVATENDYIKYIAHTTDIDTVLPVSLLTKLKERHLLFLGYSLSDWNLRAILHRIWEEQAFGNESWAIQVNPQAIDQKFWSKRNVEIIDVRLEDYIAELQARIASLKRIHDVVRPAPSAA